jgi:hypothetical protein
MDGKRQINASCIEYKGKNMNGFHTRSTTVVDFKQTRATGYKCNFFTYTYNVTC